MAMFVLRRLAAGLVLVFVITTIAYTLIYSTAGGIARNIMGENATAEQVAAKEVELGLDQPLPVQYITWLTHALRGDFGSSWFTSQSVVDTISTRLPVTLSMVIVSMLVITIVSVVMGMVAAIKGGATDRVLQVLSVVGFSLPNFWVALILVVVFSVGLGLLPATGYIPLTLSPVDWARSLILPVTALVVSGTASAAQQIRAQ